MFVKRTNKDILESIKRDVSMLFIDATYQDTYDRIIDNLKILEKRLEE